MDQFNRATALGFGPVVPPNPGDHYAPFPRMPSASPIPVQVDGVGLARTGANVVVPSIQAEGLVDFMTWLYGPDQQRVIATSGGSPVIADSSLQDAFWSGHLSAPPGGAALPGLVPPGAWRRFALPLTGIPAGAPLGAVNDLLGSFIAGDVRQLPQALASLEERLNAWQEAQL